MRVPPVLPLPAQKSSHEEGPPKVSMTPGAEPNPTARECLAHHWPRAAAGADPSSHERTRSPLTTVPGGELEALCH